MVGDRGRGPAFGTTPPARRPGGSPLITTLVDGTGLIIYFEIARFALKL